MYEMSIRNHLEISLERNYNMGKDFWSSEVKPQKMEVRF